MWVKGDILKGKSESFIRNYSYSLGDTTHPSTVQLGHFTQVQVLSLTSVDLRCSRSWEIHTFLPWYRDTVPSAYVNEVLSVF